MDQAQITRMVNAANSSGRYDITINGEYPIVAMGLSENEDALIIQLQEGYFPSGNLDMQRGTYFNCSQFYIPEGGKLLLDRSVAQSITMQSPLSRCALI